MNQVLSNGQVSRIAYEMLTSLREIALTPTELEDLEGLKKTVIAEHYKRWIALQERLRNSDLSRRLAYGLDMLPDITAHAPQFLAGILSLLRPRTPRQLAQHMARHLDWYLDPMQPIKLRSFFPSYKVVLYLLALPLACAAAAIFIYTQLPRLDIQAIASSVLALVYLYGAIRLILRAIAFNIHNNRRTRLNATALYLYLVTEWKEGE